MVSDRGPGDPGNIPSPGRLHHLADKTQGLHDFFPGSFVKSYGLQGDRLAIPGKRPKEGQGFRIREGHCLQDGFFFAVPINHGRLRPGQRPRFSSSILQKIRPICPRNLEPAKSPHYLVKSPEKIPIYNI